MKRRQFKDDDRLWYPQVSREVVKQMISMIELNRVPVFLSPFCMVECRDFHRSTLQAEQFPNRRLQEQRQHHQQQEERRMRRTRGTWATRAIIRRTRTIWATLVVHISVCKTGRSLPGWPYRKCLGRLGQLHWLSFALKTGQLIALLGSNRSVFFSCFLTSSLKEWTLQNHSNVSNMMISWCCFWWDSLYKQPFCTLFVGQIGACQQKKAHRWRWTTEMGWEKVGPLRLIGMIWMVAGETWKVRPFGMMRISKSSEESTRWV